MGVSDAPVPSFARNGVVDPGFAHRILGKLLCVVPGVPCAGRVLVSRDPAGPAAHREDAAAPVKRRHEMATRMGGDQLSPPPFHGRVDAVPRPPGGEVSPRRPNARLKLAGRGGVLNEVEMSDEPGFHDAPLLCSVPSPAADRDGWPGAGCGYWSVPRPATIAPLHSVASGVNYVVSIFRQFHGM